MKTRRTTKSKLLAKIITMAVVIVMALAVLPTLTACGNTLSNVTTPLELAIQAPEGTFSPFATGTAMDNQILSQTQVSLISADRDGNLAFGDGYTSVAQDVSINVIDDPYRPGEQRTVYQFIIRPGIYFSDGTPLTITDVLFNFYMILDNAYMGSSTLNSIPIVGLHAYRLQNRHIANAAAYRAARQAFQGEADTRIANAVAHLTQPLTNPWTDEIGEVFDIAIPLFNTEIETFWHTVTQYEAIEGRREQYYNVNYEWEAFFLALGMFQFQMQPPPNQTTRARDAQNRFIFTNRDTIANALGANRGMANSIALARNHFINSVGPYAGRPTAAFANIITGWAVAATLQTQLTAQIMNDAFAQVAAEDRVHYIEGIESLDGRHFNPSSHSTASAGAANPYAGYQMLQITIEDVNPVAIWNMGVTVAPMHWYAQHRQELVTAARAAAAREAVEFAAGRPYRRTHFGVSFTDPENFMLPIVRDLVRLPMGAGPYMMTDRDNNFDRASLETGFWHNNTAHFYRNPYFYRLAGNNAHIHMLRFNVVNQQTLLHALEDGSIHFATPSATAVNTAHANRVAHLRQENVMTNGYGYIGISAEHVPNLRIRRAIMAAIDVAQVGDFFPAGMSVPLHRGVSFNSWVWDDRGGAEPWIGSDRARYAPYGLSPIRATNLAQRRLYVRRYLLGTIATDDQAHGPLADRFGAEPVIDVNGGGAIFFDPLTSTLRWTNGGAPAMQMRFEVAGNSQEHPAFGMLFDAARYVLNYLGADITVAPNPNLLRELVAGRGRPVWAAAWGQGVDPCMFSMWHPDSSARAIDNWGIRDLARREVPNREQESGYAMALAQVIEQSRATTNPDLRRPLLQQGFDLAMELAVELPTYNRDDMFVWNTNIIYSYSLNVQNPTAFWGPMAQIWNVHFVGASNRP